MVHTSELDITVTMQITNDSFAVAASYGGENFGGNVGTGYYMLGRVGWCGRVRLRIVGAIIICVRTLTRFKQVLDAFAKMGRVAGRLAGRLDHHLFRERSHCLSFRRWLLVVVIATAFTASYGGENFGGNDGTGYYMLGRVGWCGRVRLRIVGAIIK
jgi:hypothetical protein